MARKAISKKLRFEVFKRDAFKCQYCSKCSPDVVLHVDHIQPVADGGTNDLVNLVTACVDCNMGKGARLLSDDSAVKRQREQLERINERREQLEMMLEWRNALARLNEDQTDAAVVAWEAKVDGYTPTDDGRAMLAGWIKKHGLSEVLEAIDATQRYLVRVDESLTKDSIETAFKMIPRILNVRAQQAQKPYLQRLFYIRAIARNRSAYFDDRRALALLESAHIKGASLSTLEDIARSIRNWSQFRDELEFLIENL